MKSDFLDGLGVEVLGVCRAVEDRIWVPRKRLPFGDYCEENIILESSENADYAGPYSRAMTPSVSRFLEEFLDGGGGERWRECFGTKGSQAAVTAHALFEMVRRADYAPGNIVYGIDAQKNAGSVAERYVNLLKSSQSMGEIVGRLPENDLKGDVISLPGMKVYFVGAGSVGQAASKPGVVFVIIDEIDTHKETKVDGSTVHLFTQRGKATVTGKILGFSKPTVEEGQIWQLVTTGSGHRDFLPCKHCGEFQFLEMKQIRYEHLRDKFGDLDLPRVIRDAEYECKFCGGMHREEDKREMLMNGEVRATNFVEKGEGDERELVPGWLPKRMSFYHSDLYALWENSRWGNLAVEKHAAGREPVKLKGFIQDRLGEAWKEGSARRVKIEDVREMCGDFKRGTVPKKPVLCGVFADTQDDSWKAVKVGFSADGDVMVSDWAAFLTFKNLVAWGREGIEFEGKRYPVRCNLTDEGGHRTYEVRRECSQLAPVFNPSKGIGGMQVRQRGGDLLRWSLARVFKTDREGLRKVKVLHYDDDSFRRLLYRDMILDREAVDEEGNVIERWGKLTFAAEALKDDDFLMELCREYQVRRGGRWAWENEAGNDFGDAVKMAVIGRQVWCRKGVGLTKGGES